MKIYVINLPRASDRRAHIVSSLNKFNVEYEIFSAVDGNKDPSYRERFYSSQLRMLCYARPLSNSQIGCFASHYELWKKCIELDQPILVLEDDIELASNFDALIQFAAQKIERYRYIRLWGVFERPSSQVEDGIKLYHRGPSGTQGYMLSPAAAQKFIDNATRWIEPVDEYMDKFWINGNLPYCVTPNAVYCVNEFESSIVNQSSPQRFFKITREFFKLYHVIRKKLFLMSHKV